MGESRDALQKEMTRDAGEGSVQEPSRRSRRDTAEGNEQGRAREESCQQSREWQRGQGPLSSGWLRHEMVLCDCWWCGMAHLCVGGGLRASFKLLRSSAGYVSSLRSACASPWRGSCAV